MKKNLKSQLEKIKQELQSLESEKEKIQKQAVEKIEELQNKKEAIAELLKKLQEEAKPELFKLYKQICPTEDNYGIKGENLYTFLITSGQVEVLENITDSVKNNKGAKSEEIALFNALFEGMEKCYKLERIKAKVGEEYDDTLHLKLEGDAQGKISEIILNGFKKNSNVRKKSLIKVKK